MAPASFHKTAEVYENDKAHEPGIPGEQLSLGMVAVPTPFHSGVVLEHWKRLHHWICHPDEAIPVDGKHLEISQVVAIARYGSNTYISPETYQSLTASQKALYKSIGAGNIIYGVNTGYGGSADTRTKDVERLQRVLMRELHSGIMAPGDRDPSAGEVSVSVSPHRYDLSLEHSIESAHMPWTWIRAAILIRLNSLVQGCSGIRPVVVERMQDLLKHNIIPTVPLRGSISASGDLAPLSYIGGAIQGKSTIRILSRTGQRNLYADQALSRAGLAPVALQAKEGLALVNGTAISAAVAALALHDTHGLAILSQVLTAMCVEALNGSVESFHPFFGESRPHPGQIESARNILAFLEDSKLVKINTGADDSSALRQDRYSLRTASQWIGPVLEDLVLAHQQLSIECNSATDNPLINPDGEFLHGGNFQAKAVTSAMEKARQGVDSIGRMAFAQCTEMINPAMSRGLTPNLVAEDPSISFIFKGLDVNIAALQSELGFLTHPVNHVQTAEMGNQALNSLALISARYTHTSNEVLSQLLAVHLVALCQALDLRAMQLAFLESYRPYFHSIILGGCKEKDGSITLSDVNSIVDLLWSQLLKCLDRTVNMDAQERFPKIAKSLRHTLLDHPNFAVVSTESLAKTLSISLYENWCQNRDAYLAHGDATPVLGRASKRIYNFVRRSLRVPLLSTARLTTPSPEKMDDSPRDESTSDGLWEGNNEAPTIGSYTGLVYRAIRDGTLPKVATELLQEI